MFQILYADLRAKVLAGLIDLRNWYQRLYTRVVLTIVVTATGALILNFLGYKEINIYLILPAVLVIGYIGFQPFYLLTVAATAKIIGLKAEDALGAWKKFCVQAALFSTVFLLTMGIIPIRESFGMAALLVGSLISIGLFGWSFQEGSKYYKRYVVGICIIGITIGVLGLMSPAKRISVLGFDPFWSFSISPQQDIAQRILDEDKRIRNENEAKKFAQKHGKTLSDAERAEIRSVANGSGSLANQSKKILFGEKIVYELTSLKNPQPLCGLKEGERYLYTIVEGEMLAVRHVEDSSLGRVNIEKGAAVETNGQTLPLAGMDRGWVLAFNKSLPGTYTQAGENGCVYPELNITKDQKNYYVIDGGKHLVTIRLQAGIIASLRN